VTREAWIMDGNFIASLDLRLPRADAVVWFDYPRHVCLHRVIWRVVTSYGQVRGHGAGMSGAIRSEFLRFIWDFNAKSRPQIASMLAKHRRPSAAGRVPARSRCAGTSLTASAAKWYYAGMPDVQHHPPRALLTARQMFDLVADVEQYPEVPSLVREALIVKSASAR
jgi:hypothetical protein